MFFLDSINTILFLVFFVELFLLLTIVGYGGRNRQTFFYSLNIVTILLWLISIFLYRNPNLDINFWLKILYFSALWIGITFFLFLISYPKDLTQKWKNFIYLFLAFYAGAAYFNFTTSPFVVSAERVADGEAIITFGPYYWVYIWLIVIPFALGFIRALYLMYKGDSKNEVRLIFVGYLISSQVAFTTNLIMPWIGNFSYNWVGQAATIFWVATTTYAMIRYNLLNVKLFLTDVVVFILLLLALVQFLSNMEGSIGLINSFAFAASLTAGLVIVISSRRERDATEKVKSTNQKLEYLNGQLQTLDQRKTEFINIASHQLRTPITAIKGYVGLMNDGVYGAMDPKVVQQVGRVGELSDQVLRLITDMLNISRIEENRLSYHFEKLSPNAVIDEICKSFEPQAAGKNVQFIYNIAEEKTICNLDKVLFTQCIENILDNALKYTKVGTIEAKTYTKGKKFYFVCQDTGIGIDADSMSTLFTKFARSKNATASGIDGTGIGMYLAREIMKAHNGSITLHSDGEGKGTTATLSIDL